MTLLDMPERLPGERTAPSGGEHAGQWRLARIELVNWGTFDGHYALDVARQGHLFTGASGSGKSSLLDAIATALTPGRWLKFNAAAQDNATRNDDRSLVSYVRGAWSKEADAELDRAVSSYLRSGARWSGILLRYENLRDEPIVLARLFHIKGGSVDRGDLKDLAFADRGDASLMEFAPFIASGIDTRRISAAWPNAVVTTNGSHKAYFARLSKWLGISGENALHLLHKTQSAKNLGSLDQLFRGFMLDEPSTFARARNATEQFGELNEAHRLVVDAREQVDALRKLEPSIEAFERGVLAAAEAERLSELVEVFQDRLAFTLVENERAETTVSHARAGARATVSAALFAELSDSLQVAERATLKLGGADAERARERLDEARRASASTAAAWMAFSDELTRAGIAAPNSATEFAELKETARRELAKDITGQAPLHEHADHEEYSLARNALREIDRELAALRSRRSNLPSALQDARHWLAGQLDVPESALPFAGELIEIRTDYADWTGAIERVLRPLASTMLVQERQLASTRRLVESRYFGTRLVFESVPSLSNPPRKARTAQSLLHRVRVVDGPFRDWLGWKLGAEYDFDCVESPDDLQDVDRGVTRAGQVKKSASRYEKNDRNQVNDKTQWILGADNADKIEALIAHRVDADTRMKLADERLTRAQSDRDAETRRRAVFENVGRRAWAELDRAASDELVRSRERALTDLTTGNPQLHDAYERERTIRQRWDAAQVEERAAGIELGVCADRLRQLEDDHARLSTLITGTAIPEIDSAALEARFRSVQRKIDRGSIGGIGQKVTNSLHNEAKNATDASTRARSTFEDLVHTFRSRWPAASADLTATIDDRSGYRYLRENIEGRGLPAHEQNFLKLLRDKSRELIGHLLSDIRDAPKLVKERIEPVNASLGRSPFDRDRFLRIRVREQRGPEVQAFIADLKAIVDGSWSDDELDAAEERFAVLERVMARLSSSENADLGWQKRCLDTREHVTFQAEEVDPAGLVMNVHDSSAGLSGGQRQKLVIFCLAAALRYQLAADEESVPRYGTVVLDEAFDKADSQYTRIAMDVFVTFGFHMILATPQKLLTTIEKYVGAVTAISNETRKKSTIANVVFGSGDEGPAA